MAKVDCNECLYCTLTENEQYYISQNYHKLLKHMCGLHEQELHHCECNDKKLLPIKELCDGDMFEQRQKQPMTRKRVIGIMEIYKEGVTEIE